MMSGITYTYGCLERPPGPGSVPREGLIRCADTECFDAAGWRCWGWVEYDRPLKAFEQAHYALSLIRMNGVGTAR